MSGRAPAQTSTSSPGREGIVSVSRTSSPCHSSPRVSGWFSATTVPGTYFSVGAGSRTSEIERGGIGAGRERIVNMQTQVRIRSAGLGIGNRPGEALEKQFPPGSTATRSVLGRGRTIGSRSSMANWSPLTTSSRRSAGNARATCAPRRARDRCAFSGFFPPRSRFPIRAFAACRRS